MKRNRSMLFHPGLYVETLRQLRLMGSIYLVLCVVFTIVPALLDSLSGRLTQPGISDFSPPLFLFVYVAPVTLVYSAFGFLTRRNASDFYHSLPLTRECLYVSRVLAVLTYLVGTIVLSLLGACLVYALCGRPVNLSYVPDQFLYFTACAALVMGCALVGITATGTRFSAFIVTGIVLFLPRFISVLAGAMLESVAPIFYTWDLGPVFNYSLNLPASAVATLLSFGAIGDLSLEESMRYGAGILYTGVLGLGYTVLAGFFHHFRASETAGKSAPNRVLQHVYRCAISLPVFLVLGAMLASEDWRLPFSDAALFWVLLLFALAVYFIYELVTTRKARNLLPALCVLPVVVVVGFGLPLLGRAVGERMLRAVPAAEEVAYANLGMEPFGGMESYAELQISEVDAEDEELLSVLTGALDSTVAMYDGRTDSSYGSSYFPMGVRFHLRSGEEITRRVNFRDGDLARLAALLSQQDAYREVLTRLPAEDEILAVDGPGWNQQDDRDFFALYREEYAALSYADQLLLQLSLPTYLSDLVPASDLQDSSLAFSLSGVADGQSFYTSYAITEKTPQTFLQAVQRVNEESAAAASPGEEAQPHDAVALDALRESAAWLRSAEPGAQLWAEAEFRIYEPGAAGRALDMQMGLSDAVPADYDGAADSGPAAREDLLALLDLLGDCSTQIDSLDEPIVGLTYFVLQDYATGEGVSSNTVYFRMTQEQFDRFLALTAPYANV